MFPREASEASGFGPHQASNNKTAETRSKKIKEDQRNQ